MRLTVTSLSLSLDSFAEMGGVTPRYLSLGLSRSKGVAKRRHAHVGAPLVDMMRNGTSCFEFVYLNQSLRWPGAVYIDSRRWWMEVSECEDAATKT